jgi:hypothetical protein
MSSEDTMRVLGHKFRKMENRDYYGFAGAPADALICELEDRVLIYAPSTQEMSEIITDTCGTVHENVWIVREVRC